MLGSSNRAEGQRLEASLMLVLPLTNTIHSLPLLCVIAKLTHSPHPVLNPCRVLESTAGPGNPANVWRRHAAV